MNNTKQYDAIIIGAGQGGVPLSRELAKAGKKTALIEKSHVGGTCINEGCTPTKTMVASARVAWVAGRAGDYGIKTSGVAVDIKKIRQRKRAIVESWRKGSHDRIEKTAGLDLYMGTAVFNGFKTVLVQMNDGALNDLKAETIFIDTGTQPAVPSIRGIETIPFLDSTSIMELDSLPEHLIIIGGGYIGLEFGQMFRRFGSRVTIIHRGTQLLSREDTDVAEEVHRIFREDSIDVFLKSQPVEIRKKNNSTLSVTITLDSEQHTLDGSHLLIAAGRIPNTEDLKTEATGVELNERGFIRVNERLETTVPGIYALGDVNGGPAFTHISYDDYRIVYANLIDNGNRMTTGRIIPYTVFIDPQLGRVGPTEEEVKKQGIPYRVAKIPMNWVARALELDEARGFMKAIVHSDSGQILGAAVLGIEGGEIMAVLQTAMMAKLPYTALRDGIFAHPTLAESLNNLFMNWIS